MTDPLAPPDAPETTLRLFEAYALQAKQAPCRPRDGAYFLSCRRGTRGCPEGQHLVSVDPDALLSLLAAHAREVSELQAKLDANVHGRKLAEDNQVRAYRLMESAEARATTAERERDEIADAVHPKRHDKPEFWTAHAIATLAQRDVLGCGPSAATRSATAGNC